jgi:hypothetical protein
MKTFGFKQLRRKEGPSFYLNGFQRNKNPFGKAKSIREPAASTRVRISKKAFDSASNGGDHVASNDEQSFESSEPLDNDNFNGEGLNEDSSTQENFN